MNVKNTIVAGLALLAGYAMNACAPAPGADMRAHSGLELALVEDVVVEQTAREEASRGDYVGAVFSGIDTKMMADYTEIGKVGVAREEPTGPSIGYDVVSLPSGEYNVFLIQDGKRVGTPARLHRQELYDQKGEIKPEARDKVWEQPGNVDYAQLFTIDATTL